MPATVLDIPQIRASYVADIDRGYLAQKYGGQERRYEGDASGRFVSFWVLVVESENLRATEALSYKSASSDYVEDQEAYMVSTASSSERKVSWFLQRLIKSVTLLLRTRILPIWTEWMAERALPFSLCTTL